MILHQFIVTTKDSVTTKWKCLRCECEIHTPNSDEEDSLLPDKYWMGKKKIPVDCDEEVVKRILDT